MCLTYFFEKFKKRKPNDGYVELQNVTCDSVNFNVSRACYIRSSENTIAEKDFCDITLCKDRILFGDNEYVKYDYIGTFYQSTEMSVMINIFGNLNPHTHSLYIDDSLTGIYIVFDRQIARHVLRTLYSYIENYKQYDTYDKNVKTYISFRQMFKRKRRPPVS